MTKKIVLDGDLNKRIAANIKAADKAQAAKPKVKRTKKK